MLKIKDKITSQLNTGHSGLYIFIGGGGSNIHNHNYWCSYTKLFPRYMYMYQVNKSLAH